MVNTAAGVLIPGGGAAAGAAVKTVEHMAEKALVKTAEKEVVAAAARKAAQEAAAAEARRLAELEAKRVAEAEARRVAEVEAKRAAEAGTKPAASQYGPDQDALIQLAKEKRRTGVTVEEAKTLRQWGQEYNVPVRGPESHPNRPFGKEPHLHVGPVDHLPVKGN